MKSFQKILKYSLFIFLIVLFVLVLVELGVRTYQQLVHKIPFTHSPLSHYDATFGWEGKKIFGNPRTDRLKIFVVGDSFTDGEGADETKMYYRVLAKNLNAELFVYAAGGYGTVQEYLVIDKFYDEIKPDLIVLQVCSNDFINNSYQIEKGSYTTNNLLVRPYWINGEIKYYYPRFLGEYRIGMTHISRLAYMVFNSVDIILADLAAKGKIVSAETIMSEKGMEYKPFVESKEAMTVMVKKMRERANGVPIVAAATNTSPFYTEHFQDVFKAADIPFTIKPAAAVERAEAAGANFSLGKRGHWNSQGNQIFGQALLDEIQTLVRSNVIQLPVKR